MYQFAHLFIFLISRWRDRRPASARNVPTWIHRLGKRSDGCVPSDSKPFAAYGFSIGTGFGDLVLRTLWSIAYRNCDLMFLHSLYRDEIDCANRGERGVRFV